jgi:uncharacterized membrane protein YgaE (UPF0421/DUF939 family)
LCCGDIGTRNDQIVVIVIVVFIVIVVCVFLSCDGTVTNCVLIEATSGRIIFKQPFNLSRRMLVPYGGCCYINMGG